MDKSKLVYIASPYAGDVEKNVQFARAACRYAMAQGVTPVAPHLLYPQLLDDSVLAERDIGIQMGLRLLVVCDELWLCGSRISQGMREELMVAGQLGIPVRRITDIPLEAQEETLSNLIETFSM
ncbi:DUF7768 domain-containing protein [Eisenbergiella sp.]